MKRIVLICGVVALLAGITLQARRETPGFADRLSVNSRLAFLSGVNYPYKSSQDFGTGAWGYSGAADPTTNQEIETDFANLEASGVRVVKWRIFNDGRYSPDFAPDGYATGLDDRFFPDLDAALALARKHNLYLILTLFSSGFWTTDCNQKGVQLGGHGDALTDPARRQALLDRAIVPMLRHIGSNDRVLAFEIIAEPEWGIAELNHDRDNRSKVPLDDVRALVGQVTDAIHYYTPALVTVESNRSSNMANWRGLGLDYYSFSWYDWLQPYEPLDRPAASFGLDRPIVLGEFPSYGSKYYPLTQVFDIVYRDGYAGAFAWSYGNQDQYSNWSQVDDAFLRWMSDHWDLVDVSARAAIPANPVQLLPPPYQFQNVKVVEGNDGSYLQAQVAVPTPGTYHLQWFLYDAAADPKTPSDQQSINFSDAAQQLGVQIGSLVQGRTYKMSLGIFDQNDHLVKWFDGMAVLKLQGGVPAIQTKVVEDPCGVQVSPAND